MGLSSSLNAGVAGLNVNASKLSTISDNIANSGTNGYKRATIDFSSVVTGESTGSYDAGGVRATSGRDINVRGALLTSENSTDISITGRGLLPVTPVGNREDDAVIRPLNMVSTGSFQQDEEGYMVTSSGLQLLGWPTDQDGNVAGVIRGSGASLEPVQVSGFDFASDPTTRVDLGINLPSTETAFGADGTALETGVEYFDELGASQQLTLSFTPTVPGTAGANSNEWTLTITDNASTTDADGGVVGVYTITFYATDTVVGTDTHAAGSIASVTANNLPISGTASPAYDGTSGSLPIPVGLGTATITTNIGVVGQENGFLTQFAAEFAPLNVAKDGSSVGTLSRVEFTSGGYLEAVYDTGFRQTLYQVPIVDVPNPNGLTALDNQSFSVSPSSGPIYLWDAGAGPVGDILGFALEQSATDIAQELTQLIETQRAYSSNATVITTVDEMLQETTNIGR